LHEGFEVALIYNPAVTEVELLQAINREFKICSASESRQELVDALTEFLLRVNGQGKKVALMIDEAQHLLPPVLEQLRLVSNLETETGKLIQIILVGQLELAEILSRKEMRQLEQRIVVRGRLNSFSLQETTTYLRHRLTIAAAGQNATASFSAGACRAVQNYSGGTPRLINIIADRSLLVGYAEGKRHIDRGIVKKARRDLDRPKFRLVGGAAFPRRQVLGILFLVGLLCWGWLYRDSLTTRLHGKDGALRTARNGKETGFGSAVPAGIAHPGTQQVKIEVQTRERLFAPMERLSRQENWQYVLRTACALWGQELTVEPDLPVGALPEALTLNTFEFYGNLNGLKSLNYPAVVELRKSPHELGIFAVLKQATDHHLVVVSGDELLVPSWIFHSVWYGHAYILWKDFERLPRRIDRDSEEAQVLWLQNNLRCLDCYYGEASGIYDRKTEGAVMRFQKLYNLSTDGIVGPQTKMMLYSLLNIYEKPRLLAGYETEYSKESGLRGPGLGSAPTGSFSGHASCDGSPE
jgi:general secretion pathway protein A